MFCLFLFIQKRIKNKLKKEREIYLGDIIINLNKIKEKNNKKSFKLEFNKLWVHGLAHLFGYKHKKTKISIICLDLRKNLFFILIK